jgi:hypothetical protein
MALDNSTLAAFQADMRSDLGNLIRWASTGTPTSTATATPAVTVAATGSARNSAFGVQLDGLMAVIAFAATVFVC